MKESEEFLKPIFTDERSFEAVFREYYSSLYRVVQPIVKSGDRAEDIVQELFVKLWNKRSATMVGSNLKSYLYRAAVNAALDHLDKYKKETGMSSGGGLEQGAAVNTVEEDYAAKEMEEQISRAVDKLPPACKTIFLLSREEEMTYRQIADTLEISVKTVENQMGKALKILREELKPYLGDIIKCLLVFLAQY